MGGSSSPFEVVTTAPNKGYLYDAKVSLPNSKYCVAEIYKSYSI